MHQTFLAYMSVQDEFYTQVLMYFAVAFVVFLIFLYIFRSIFNIPSFLRYQKAQTKLLEEIAKKHGVEDSRLKSIVSESVGWENTSNNA